MHVVLSVEAKEHLLLFLGLMIACLRLGVPSCLAILLAILEQHLVTDCVIFGPVPLAEHLFGTTMSGSLRVHSRAHHETTVFVALHRRPRRCSMSSLRPEQQRLVPEAIVDRSSPSPSCCCQCRMPDARRCNSQHHVS